MTSHPILSQRTATVTPDGSARCAATIGRPDPGLGEGDPLGALAHWWMFPDTTPTSALGADGYPPRHPDLPGTELPVRMFAGATLRRSRPLRVGDRAQLTERLVEARSATASDGRPLVFATVRWDVSVDGGVVLVEDRTVVYTVPGPPAGAHPFEGTPSWRRRVEPDERLLFRFSALTWNTHRIHYDRTFATEVDGHPDLVVHGPLLATLLVDLWEHEDPRPVVGFTFRARRPLHLPESFTLVGGPDGSLAALGTGDIVAMSASVTPGEGLEGW